MDKCLNPAANVVKHWSLSCSSETSSIRLYNSLTLDTMPEMELLGGKAGDSVADNVGGQLSLASELHCGLPKFFFVDRVLPKSEASQFKQRLL